MKKILIVVLFFLALTISACTSSDTQPTPVCDTPVTCTPCDTVEPCETCVTTPQGSFYEAMDFPAAGYTPAYTYFLSGQLSDAGIITQIRFDMVSITNVSKRSTDYMMNVAHVIVGGQAGHQFLDIFIGGSTQNIPQVFNYIRGAITASGEEMFMSVPLQGMFPGAPVNHRNEIYELLSTGLNIEITETTTVRAFLTALNLFNQTSETATNGRRVLSLKGRWGGGTFDEQLTALETYIVENQMTLTELYELLSTTNQGYDNRDLIAGTTMLFEPKILAIIAQAANITISETIPTVIGLLVESDAYYVTVRIKGWKDMIVRATFNTDKVLTLVEVLNHTETPGYGEDVILGTYLADIVTNYMDLDGLDPVAGATVTSNALKNAVKLAMEYLEK